VWIKEELKNKAAAHLWKHGFHNEDEMVAQKRAISWIPNLDHLHLPSEQSKVLIVTGRSLASRTSLIRDVEMLLGPRHAATFSKIGQHAPVADLDQVTDIVQQDPTIDTIISIGGGSPIDSAKVVSYRHHKDVGQPLFYIAIPTTLSAAECTSFGGFTNLSGVKSGVGGAPFAPNTIIYDARFALQTPPSLWLSTGLRALDHAIELLYHPSSSELARSMVLHAANNLFVNLPLSKKHPDDLDIITTLQFAAFSSLMFMGLDFKGPLGLSHSLGYALGSPYNIPHGITSCVTLGQVVKFKAEDPVCAKAISRLLLFMGQTSTGNHREDALKLGDMVVNLVNEELGLKTTLTERGVARGETNLIVERALGGTKSGPVFEQVKALVDYVDIENRS
jgi:alcohol dehydrogenase class IV